MKKLVSFLSAAVLAFTGSATALPTASVTAEDTSTTTTTEYNYGEALQKSMFFYEVQQSGELPDWNEVSWRADSMVNDYVPGGWYDAGDHLKFTLTNAYAATMLGWGLLSYGDGVDAIGQRTLYENNLQFALDYLVGCDLEDEIVYMIGDGSFDHVWWGAAEMYMNKYELQTGNTERPYYTCNDSCIEAQMAAALATGYLNFKDSQPDKAQEYLTHAVDLFERADAYRAIGDDTAEKSYYNISSFYDDLFYAANWLYLATGEQKYLDLCASDYISNLGTEEQSTELKYTWGHCWDDVMQGGMLLYAINTGDDTWKNQVKKHLEYWTTGYGGKQVSHTPDGLAWLFQWGSLRHATTTAFLAYVAADELFAEDATLSTKYTEFADDTMNYCFGDNDNNFSYVVGMGDNYPKAWHHRTSSGAWNDKWSNIGQTEGDDAKQHAHILYGALVGGPDQTGKYSDNIGDYQYTEVAIDYNAGYTAALCAMVSKYGGTSDPDFPPTETPSWNEFFMQASINQSASSYTELKVYAMNHSAWPARTITNLSYNYYFDISELVDAGYSIDDVSVRVGYDQHSSDKGKISISDPIQYSGTIYYVKLSFADGSVVMPTGQSEHRSECQFRISIPDNIQGVWDPTNDYSYEGLVQGGEDAMIVTDKITMYDGDTLIWGTEPDGTTPDDVTPVVTTTATTEPTVTTTTETIATTVASTPAETTISTTLETTGTGTQSISSDQGTTEQTFNLTDLNMQAGDKLLIYLNYDGVSGAGSYNLSNSWSETNAGSLNNGENVLTFTAAEAMDSATLHVTLLPSAAGTVNMTDYEVVRATVTDTTTKTTTTTTTTKATSSGDQSILYGDVNLDGNVQLNDAVLLSKAAADAVVLSDAARANADCNTDGVADGSDIIVLLRFLVQIIDTLPYAE